MAVTPVGDLWGIHTLSSAVGMTLALRETEVDPGRLGSLPTATQLMHGGGPDWTLLTTP